MMSNTRQPISPTLTRVGNYVVGPRSNLYGADLRDLDLSFLDLRRSDLRTANARGTNFTGSDVRGVLWGGTLLSGANFFLARGAEDIPPEYELRNHEAVRIKPTDWPGAHREKPEWYSFLIITKSGPPHPSVRNNFRQRRIRLQELLAHLQFRASHGKLPRDAHATVVWKGNLTLERALRDPDHPPLCYVLQDGSIVDKLT